jgi:uncharacterized circularly permuted ATP-grasp superfamily protein
VNQMLAPVLKELDENTLSDSSLDPAVFERLVSAQRELGLVFGNRPTCPFLRPHVIARSQYDEVAGAACTIAFAVERVVNRALRDDELFAVFGLTEREAQMARVDPGYGRLCVTSRLDSYLTDEGFQFLEYNAEPPAGVGDQMQLEKVLLQLVHVRKFLEQHAHWRPEPHRRLLAALLQTYREWGGEADSPQIAIVDWKGVATESEFYTLKDYFASQGHQTLIVDPRELNYDGRHLSARGTRIDIVYKRVIIHEFLEACDANHPLARAYADGRVCMVNSFRTKVAHKKAGFAILSDPKYEDLFTPEEIAVFRKRIPWTRRVVPAITSFHGKEHDLLPLISDEQQRFVLKPNDDYGGHGVFLGWEASADEWKRAIALASERPYVVQEKVGLQKIQMPMFSGKPRMAEMYVDFNPFLFDNEVEGALIRLSSSEILNVTSGGGQTALLVLEGI